MTNHPVRSFLLFSICGFSLLVVTPAEDTRLIVSGPSFEEVISLRSVANPTISPDGKSVAYTMNTVDWEENRFNTEIWLARDREEPFQLTRNPKGSSDSPKWSPDGRWLAFLSDRGEKKQLFVIRANGGEAQPLTDKQEGVSSFEWSPAGGKIAFSSPAATSKEKKQQKKLYGEFAIEDTEYENLGLWLIEFQPDPVPGPGERSCSEPNEQANTDDGRGDSDDESPASCDVLAKPTELVGSSDFTVGAFEWSRDGSQIVFEHREDPLINSFVTADISIVEVASGNVRSLVEGPGFDGSPQWSPDSKWILYTSSGGNTTSNFFRNELLLKIPSEGGDPIQLGGSIDESLGNVRWTPKGIYTLVLEKTARRLYRIDEETGNASVLISTPRNIWSLDASADGHILAITGQDPDTLAEVFKGSADEWSPVRLTNVTSQLEGWPVGTSEVISWKSQDGTEIEGVLYKPQDFDPTRKYPLMVVIHGGPTGIDYPSPVRDYVYPITQWLAKGAVVLRPNYRGSAGYGEKFRSLNVRNLGVGDAWDVMSGVDFLIGQGMIDPERMGAMGWSQGGYISAFLTTNTDRFAAISVGAGISNWVTYYVNTDIHPFTRQYLEAVPWDDPEIYARTSPMTTIRNAKTPTLIQHGEFDRRVPIPNAYELFQGLQDRGVETRLIVYKGFGHGITKPKERLAATWHNYQWFAKYIWGEEVELPLGLKQEE